MTKFLTFVTEHVRNNLRDLTATRTVNATLNSAPFPETPAVELVRAFQFISGP